MKVIMLDNKIAVEAIVKKRTQQGGLLHIPEATNCTGIVKYLSEGYSGVLKVGDTVCYGSSRQQVRMLGEDLQIMEPDNIFAILEDSDEKETEKDDKKTEVSAQ